LTPGEWLEYASRGSQSAENPLIRILESFSQEARPMPKVKQLTVACENRPGTLAEVARVLGDAKVNILAFALATTGPEGFAQLIVDNVNKAKKALDAAALRYTEEEVLQVKLANVPGALGHFAGKLAAKRINITSGYQTTVKGARQATVVFAVSDLEKAARIR
jgi:hypothetical protein